MKSCSNLEWEPSVAAAHIGVSAEDGIVILAGYVLSYAERYLAERAAKRVYGVKAVANELDVKLSGDSRRTDGDIAAATVVEASSRTPLRAGQDDPGRGSTRAGSLSKARWNGNARRTPPRVSSGTSPA